MRSKLAEAVNWPESYEEGQNLRTEHGDYVAQLVWREFNEPRFTASVTTQAVTPAPEKPKFKRSEPEAAPAAAAETATEAHAPAVSAPEATAAPATTAQAAAPQALINTEGLEADIDREQARRAFYWTSFHPEKRGDSVISEYVGAMKELADYITEQAKAPRQQAIAQEVFDDLRGKYRSKVLAWVAAQSRCISAMITGPAKFPVRRAEKANESERKRSDEMLYFYRSMRGYALKSLERVFSTVEKLDTARTDLQAKIDEAEKHQEFMRKANALHRSNDTEALKQHFIAAFGEGLAEGQLQQFLKPDYALRAGFHSYELSNNLANIKRMKDRLAELDRKSTKAQAEPQQGDKREGLEIVRNHAEDRLQLLFDGKPAEEVRELLKSHGFKWSPRFGAWQRQLTSNAEHVLANRVLTNPIMAAYKATASDANHAATTPTATLEAKLIERFNEQQVLEGDADLQITKPNDHWLCSRLM